MKENTYRKKRIESLGGNWSGFKIKLREVRDGGREGKRELRSAFNDEFFLSCSFHILFFFFCPFSTLHRFFFPKGEMQDGKGSVVPSSSYDRNSPSLPLPHSLCPSPRPPQSILDPRCQLQATVKPHPSPRGLSSLLPPSPPS